MLHNSTRSQFSIFLILRPVFVFLCSSTSPVQFKSNSLQFMTREVTGVDFRNFEVSSDSIAVFQWNTKVAQSSLKFCQSTDINAIRCFCLTSKKAMQLALETVIFRRVYRVHSRTTTRYCFYIVKLRFENYCLNCRVTPKHRCCNLHKNPNFLRTK